MGLHELSEKVGRVEALDAVAKPVSSAAKRVIGRGWLKDVLSGTWLGHTLHPLLTDIPIGSFTSATVVDMIGGDESSKAAELLTLLGLASAVPTAAAGAADWSETYGEDVRTGLVHAVSNVIGLAFYALTLQARRRGDRGRAVVLGLAGMSSMTVGGYLGGYLSYTRGVGVNNAFFQHHPDDWVAVMDETALPEGKPVRVEVEDATVLLYRRGEDVFAISNRCTHAGGPLDEGNIDERACTVECPWHQSVFRLQDGTVVHGPASVPQVAYDVRRMGGKVEVRRRAL